MNREYNLEEVESISYQFPLFIKKTPITKNERLSQIYECEVFFKREDLQDIRSYKIRGAYNKIQTLSNEQQQRGIVCASAGNHAQGVAYIAANLKINATIFMPKITPMQKVRKTKHFGGNYVDVQLIGDSFDEAYNSSIEFCDEHGLVFVHPFDDIETVKGQATVGYEIMQELPQVDYIIAPVGGGGLIAGIIYYVKQVNPNIKIIGVEPKHANSLSKALEYNKPVVLDNISTFVDGASVKKIGECPFAIIKDKIDEVVLVSEDRICTTLIDTLQEDGIVLEPAGTLSVDALKDLTSAIKGKKVLCVTSGGNFDFDKLPEVKERSLRFGELKKYYILYFPQRAGALKEFLNFLGPEDDIVRFEYLKKVNKEKGPAIIGIETYNSKNFKIFEQKLKDNQYAFEDVTQNEIYYDFLI